MSKSCLRLLISGDGTGRASEVAHEDLFVARYEQLLSWACDSTEGDSERAEDLVQDAFIQFTLSRPVLDQIENLNGYLLFNLFNSCRRFDHLPRCNDRTLENNVWIDRGALP
jgi:hypothetical protein